MKFYIYVKSHCEAPDYENECEAENKFEAAKIFVKGINQRGGDYDTNMIMKDIVSEKEMGTN